MQLSFQFSKTEPVAKLHVTNVIQNKWHPPIIKSLRKITLFHMTMNYGGVTLLTETIILMSLNGFLKILLCFVWSHDPGILRDTIFNKSLCKEGTSPFK